MMHQKKVLAIVEDPALLKTICKWMTLNDLGDPIQAPSAVEGIAFFESYQPDAVILEDSISDMPLSFMVSALCQLSDGTPIWIIAPGGVLKDPQAFPEGAFGVIPAEMGSWPVNALFQKLPILNMRTSHDQDDTIGIWNDDSQNDSFFPESVMTAEDVNARGSLVAEGDLCILGDLANVQELVVRGDLTIQGHCHNSHIQCDGNLTVQGRIQGQTNGVFCAGTLEVERIDQALVVCGKNLFFRESCKDSIINVLGRMIGTGPGSSILGGRIRVGQHISVSQIGDDQQTDTWIEMAPAMFHGKLLAPFSAMKNNGKSVPLPKKLEEMADISVESLYEGVTLRFGEEEDFTIKDYIGGYRVFLNQKVRIQKRKKFSME